MPDKGNPSYHHIPNQIVNPKTGFLENKGYDTPFDSTQKQMFIEVLRTSGFKVTIACDSLGISHHTYHHHKRSDQAFSKAIEDALDEYRDALEWKSRAEAMESKNYVERMFQLKALRPEIYADFKPQRPMEVTLNINFDGLSKEHERTHSIDAEIVQELQQTKPPPTDTGHNEGHALDGK